MSLPPVEAEATGQPFIVADYGGHEYKLPADVDDWPLPLIAVTVGIRDGVLVADHEVLARALAMLLGDQWAGFLAASPRRGDLLPASAEFAAAAGFTGTVNDLSFGALPRLLATLDARTDAVEATLAEMGVDYRDRWRFDADGRRLLTLRQVNLRLAYAPYDCALAIAQNDGRRPLSGTELLLMDVFEAITHTRHPSRPMTAEQEAARATKAVDIEAERAKYRERHKPLARVTAIETARANARLGRDSTA